MIQVEDLHHKLKEDEMQEYELRKENIKASQFQRLRHLDFTETQ